MYEEERNPQKILAKITYRRRIWSFLEHFFGEKHRKRACFLIVKKANDAPTRLNA